MCVLSSILLTLLMLCYAESGHMLLLIMEDRMGAEYPFKAKLWIVVTWPQVLVKMLNHE